MKSSTLLFLLLCSIFNSFSQSHKKHLIGVNGGISIPIPDYSKHRAYAVTGASLYLNDNSYFKKKLAATINIGFGNNKENKDQYRNFEGSRRIHNVGYSVLGVRVSFGDRLRAYVNPVVGVGSYHTIGADGVAYFYSNGLKQEYKFNQEDTKLVLGLMYGGSIGTLYQLSEKISVTINLLVLNSDFKEIDVDYYNNRTIQYDQWYSTANFTLGIGYSF